MILKRKNVIFSRLMQVYVGILAAYFCHSRQSQVEYNCSLIKVDWLAACIALRVVGAVLVVYLRHWRKICTILQQWEASAGA
jgi:hypothetical protein